jgi:2-keto-4-pentenoate hydratase/2-oxohepta-3-ene-1,7-dioic acid hydratase in catechol pathway
VHEWSDVRLLAPLGQPPSLRLFAPFEPELTWAEGEDAPTPSFEYLNPSALVGPGFAIPWPEWTRKVSVDACLGVVIGGAGRFVSLQDADELVLGLTLVTSFYVPGVEGGRGRDVGFALGPAITTPDELDDSVTVDERGRRYRFGLTLKVNSDEVGAYDLSSLPQTIAELLTSASSSCTIQQGDVIAVNLGANNRVLEKGDQVQLVCEKLGALTTRVG